MSLRYKLTRSQIARVFIADTHIQIEIQKYLLDSIQVRLKFSILDI